MKARFFLFGIILTLLAAIVPLAAQAQQPLTVRVDRVDATSFPQLTLYLTVRDGRGLPVAGLTASQFDVSEDRTLKSRPISQMETVTAAEVPTGVILVLDISGSMTGQPLADAQTAAVRFLDRLGPQDRAALIAFASQVNLGEPFPQLDPAREHDFTTDKQPLYALIDGLQAGGGTPLYDAVYKAVQLAARQPAGHRAVLLLSDGRDEDKAGGPGSSVADASTPIREANRAGVPVFTVGLGKQIDAPFLKRLAGETGGLYQQTPDSAQVAKLFQNVADRLKQQYRLTYKSAVPADGKQHRVRVTVRRESQVAFNEASWTTAPPPEEQGKATPAETPVPPAVTATPTLVPPAPGITPTPVAPPARGLSNTMLAILGSVALIVFGGVAFLMRGRGSAAAKSAGVPRCLNCGRELESEDAPCPDCGQAGQYRG